jgi:hypothetical protein
LKTFNQTQKNKFELSPQFMAESKTTFWIPLLAPIATFAKKEWLKSKLLAQQAPGMIFF